MNTEKVKEICEHLEETAQMMGFDLQPSLAGCEILESIILGLSEIGNENSLKGAQFMCGVYLGEIIRTAIGGSWVYSETSKHFCLELDDTQYFPIERVAKFTNNPSDYGLLFFAQAIIAKP